MIKVLFDHQIFSWQRYGGISRYFANLHHEINLKNDIQAKTSTLYSENYYIRDSSGILNKGFGKLILSKSSRRYKWNKQYNKYLIKSGNFDILHPTYYNPYFIKKTKKPFIITVHDMIHELMPEFFNPNDIVSYQKRLCIEKARHIIAISETTKNDLVNILNVDERRISVIHHGYCIPNEQKKITTEKEKKHLLYVGDRAGYKNFTNFVTAIAPLLRERKDLKLVCAGGGQFLVTENELLLRHKLLDKVTQVSASEQQLNDLYTSAIAFVFPSLYEGFGLPILEAFQHNCPVIASNHACFKEVLGNAGLYFDPRSHTEILANVTKIVDDLALQEQLAFKGQEQLLKFSMENCLNKTLDVYRNI